MVSKKILALSSSKVGNTSYLETAALYIENFLGTKATNIAFFPFASVGDYEDYTNKVGIALKNLPLTIRTVMPENAISVIKKSDAIMVGGGNTFKLLHDIYQLDLLKIIRDKVNKGFPYIGWSAGANILGRTIGTTNDMPIIEPKSFNALGLFPFQINPHYINQKLEGFNGETRDQRLEEFVKLNRGTSIVALPEGTALELKENQLKFIGTKPAVLFYYEKNLDIILRKEITGETDLSSLL